MKKAFLLFPVFSAVLRNINQKSSARDHARRVGHSRALVSCLTLIAATLAAASCGGAAAGMSVTFLTYPTAKISATKGSAIADIVPAIVPGDATVEYTVKPPLPAGLELDPKSGTISGTPMDAYVEEAVYTVTATGTNNYAGTVNVNITITIGVLSSVTFLTYPTAKISATKGSAIADIVPAIVPGDATVEYTVKPPLPAGLELDPKSGTISGTPMDAYVEEAVYTVTATGTNNYAGTVNVNITITIGVLSTSIEVNTVPKANPAEDKRYHYVLFTIQADGVTSMERHKFALSLKTDSVPTVQEMNDGDGVYRIVHPTEKKVLLSYTLGSGISNLMTDSNYLGKMVKHGDQIGATASDTADVDSYLLSPGTEYTLYALKDGGNSVEELYDFTTDRFDKTSTFTDKGRHLDAAAFGGEYMVDLNDAVFVFPISFIPPSSGSHPYAVSIYSYADDLFIKSLGGRIPPASYNFNNGEYALLSVAVASKNTILVPSQSLQVQLAHGSLSATYPHVSMGNTKIVTWYLLMPMNVVNTGRLLRFRTNNDVDIVAITPTLDQ